MGYLIRLLLLGLTVFLGYRALVRWLTGGGQKRELRDRAANPPGEASHKDRDRLITDQPIEEADYEELP